MESQVRGLPAEVPVTARRTRVLEFTDDTLKYPPTEFSVHITWDCVMERGPRDDA